MKFNKNKRMFLAMYTAMMSAVMLTGFASSTEAQEQSAVEAEVSTEPSDQEETLDDTQSAGDVGTDWCVSQEVIDVQSGMIENVKIAAVEAKIAYEAKLEEERRAAEEAERIAREKAEAAAAQAEAEAAQQAEKELLASLIFCEAGNQPYEGQVAVGAVVMNRIKSSSYPDTMGEVIYQSGQFSPAMSGWLDRVRANQGYTEAAMQAAEDALAGSNPIGDCLYFSVGGYGTRIGDHLFH